MSKFSVGDRVRVVQLTDLDAEQDDPDRVVKDNKTAIKLFGSVGPKIGDVGVISDIWGDDYYQVGVDFDDGDPTTNYSFVDDDLELVED